jgi:U4/U6 small nuclear ribonucleoprotein PRP4
MPTRAPAPSAATASTSDVEDEVGYEVSDDHRAAWKCREHAVQELLQRHRAYAMVVPTNDSAVHVRLHRLGKPIMLFSEHEMECRDRLCALMVHLEVEGRVDLLLREQEDHQAIVGGGPDPVPLLH